MTAPLRYTRKRDIWLTQCRVYASCEPDLHRQDRDRHALAYYLLRAELNAYLVCLEQERSEIRLVIATRELPILSSNDDRLMIVLA